jgi:hypothetical protein
MPLKVKVKLPKRFDLDAGKMAVWLGEALNETVEEAQALFAKTSATFEDKPSLEVNRPGGQFMRRLSTTNENYSRLNYGTKAHLISPKPGGILRFPSAFGPKTMPGQLFSLGGYKSGDMVVTSLPVLNPGLPARGFDKAVAKAIKAKFRKRVQTAIKQSVKA